MAVVKNGVAHTIAIQIAIKKYTALALLGRFVPMAVVLLIVLITVRYLELKSV